MNTPSPYSDIILCDDHPICLMGIEGALKNAFGDSLQIRKAALGKDLLQLVNERMPNLVILDLGLPDVSGVELIRTLREISPHLKILLLTSNDNPILLNQALLYKVNGILLKTYSIQNIAQVLKELELYKDQVYIDPSVESLFNEKPSTPLTKREHEVLSLLAKGHTNKEIATLLNCSAETIKSHRSNIMNKSKTRNSAEMIAWYLQGNGKRDPSSDA